MANLRKGITDRKATEAKTLLWQGVSQSKVCLLVGCSQATISRIVNGTTAPDSTWPNGMKGPMPDRTMAREQGWSDEAADFMRMPDIMQTRILEIVNTVRGNSGDPPIPHTAPEYEEMLRMDPTDRAFEQVSIAESRLAEDRRMASLMLQFNEIMDERRAAQDDTEINRIIVSTVSKPDEGAPLPNSIGSLSYSKLSWDEVCYRAYKVRIVKLAMIGERVALKEACCIVLHALQGARTSWNLDSTEDLIRSMADKLEGLPDVMERLITEYADVPVGDISIPEV